MAMAMRDGTFDPAAFAVAMVLPDDLSFLRDALVYLATPYSKRAVGPDGRYSTFLAGAAAFEAALWSAALARRGVTAISPIVLAHEACAACCDLDPLDATMWSRWCAPLLKACDVVVVPDIHGWRDSDGVRAEIRWAAERGVPVFLVERMP